VFLLFELTLDPEDWEKMKILAQKMATDMVSYHQNIRDVKPFIPPTKQIIEEIKESLPLDPLGSEETYKQFKSKILKNHGASACSPGCWNTVIGTGTTFGALADMWMSGLNSLSTTNTMFSSYVELQVIEWFKEMLSYPLEASGVLVSGGSMSNLLALTVARNTKAGYDIKKEGGNGKLVFYGSNEMHYSIDRDLEVLGVGSNNLRKISVDDQFRVNVDELRKKIKEDKIAGLKPVCVVGCAGTTNTGSFDDLEALAELCREEDLWFHVDGAFGAWVQLSPKYKHLVKGMEKADSLTFDLHKWMYMPYGIGCVLVRDADAHYRSFAHEADYIKHDRSLVDFTVELSRPFRSLKAWMSLKEHGVKKYAALIEQNIEQAKYFGKRVEETAGFELLAPVVSNIVCFRYKGIGLDEDEIKRLRGLTLSKWYEELPDFIPTSTVVNGKQAIRLCITNHRTTRQDLDKAFDWFLNTLTKLSSK